ncbi:MAG: hypothetical protein HQ546_06880 [Planctomycetes bacterium]|nr:hypothetical protein [Planctomycetota bacterium]
MCGDRYETTYKVEFKAIHEKLNHIDEALRGNGKPGVNIRLDRLERVAAVQARMIWVVLTAVVGLVVQLVWKTFC